MVKQWLDMLKKAGVDAPAFALSQLIFSVTGLTPAKQLCFAQPPMTCQQQQTLEALVMRRCAGEPLQYLLGNWEFYGLEFAVGPGVLIPRADTETLVEAVLQLCHTLPCPQIAELCSGSGCVAVALAHCLPKASITAVELSPCAFAYLEENVAKNKVCNVTPLCANALELAAHFSKLDVVAANPPYLATKELATLQREVQHEPRMALDGKEDGLFFYRAFTRLYAPALKAGGFLCYEVGDTQALQVQRILEENGYENIRTYNDLEGFTRVVAGQKSKAKGHLQGPTAI